MGGEVVLVAVDATKEITDYALQWAVRNVIRAVDSLILLALLQSHGPGSPGGNPRKNQHSTAHKFLACLLKKWGLHRDVEKSASQVHDGVDEKTHKINNVCVQMMRQLCSANNVRQIKTQVQVVANARMGSVALKAEELGATWVVLDRRLKKEGDCCLKQLNCNIILIDHAIPKILRSINTRSKEESTLDSIESDQMVADMPKVFPNHQQLRSTNASPESSISSDTKSTNKNISSSLSSADKDDSQGIRNGRSSEPFLNQNFQLARQEYKFTSMYQPTSPSTKSQPLKNLSRFDTTDELLAGADPIDRRIRNYTRGMRGPKEGFSGKLMDKPFVPTLTRRSTDCPKSWQRPRSPAKPKPPNSRGRRSKDGSESDSTGSTSSPRIDRTSSIRKAMSLSFKQPPTPPPLCSVCKHNAPIFGKPPRKFSYEEVEIATNGFSRDNFLAEGGYGPVYRGVLPDGQVVAVKQQKVVSAQGASEFCAEVEVLSCAQHRNLVMLVGYCMDREWLLVYEFACNGSLDKHLYGKDTREVMAWQSRQKVAVGAARGLRYLHEDCRVGCIVHRDLRPNNILLTHDFEAMVGDFGLARWQADGQLAEETRIIGAFGYLAPEYTQTGLITEKADVYAFGVVLMELLTGQKAIDTSRGHKEQYLPEWGRPLLEKKMLRDIIDPRLEGNYLEPEVERMMYAASSCISPDPERRPRMSKVLRILEGDMPSDMASQVNHFQYTHKNIISSTGDERNSTNNPYPYHSLRKPIDHKDENSPSLHSDYGSPLSNRLTTEHTKLVPSPRSRTKPRSINEIPSVGHEMGASSSWTLNQSEQLGGEEYQAYLHGSLTEFIQKMNEKHDEYAKTVSLSGYGYPVTPPSSKRSF